MSRKTREGCKAKKRLRERRAAGRLFLCLNPGRSGSQRTIAAVRLVDHQSVCGALV